MPHSVILTQFGSPAAMTFSPAAMPQAAEDEVVVKMRVAPVNPADIFSVLGVYPGFTSSLPAIPGLEGMGEVSSVGSKVGSTHPELVAGKRVVPLFMYGEAYLRSGKGSWTEYAVFKAEHLIPVPESVSDSAAAQSIVNPCTAVAMLNELNVPTGEYLLQSGASSVLGRMVIQLAKHRGIKTINVVRRAGLEEELSALGADHVLVSAGSEDVATRVKTITGGRMAYGGLDSVGGELTSQLTGAIRSSGTLIIYGAMAGIKFEGSIIDSLFRDVTIKGFWVAPYMTAKGLTFSHALAQEVLEYMSKGVIVPYCGETFPLEKVSAAVEAAQQAARGGKVLLKMA